MKTILEHKPKFALYYQHDAESAICFCDTFNTLAAAKRRVKEAFTDRYSSDDYPIGAHYLVYWECPRLNDIHEKVLVAIYEKQ